MSAPQSDWTARLQRWCTEGAELSEQAGNDPEQLLVVLRQLEQLHRDLQDGPFRNSLPSDRHQLYKLLQAMEQNGGWPYIPGYSSKPSWNCWNQATSTTRLINPPLLPEAT